MKTKAIRLYGKKDLRLEEFELPQIKDDEILAKVVSDSLCMSSYKASTQATDHKRVPNDVAENPIIIGHEFAGELVEVGSKWASQFKAGDKFSIQPALNYENGPVGILSAPGYSYQHIGGDATYVIIPREVMENNCLLAYKGEGYYPASLAEPLSCVIGAIHANYHTTPGSYVHKMDIVANGKMAILAGVGPMGLAAINYVLRREDRHPSLCVVTDVDQTRLDRAAGLYTVEFAAAKGIDLRYVNTSGMQNAAEELKAITGGEGYNDVFVFAPVKPVVEQADAILAFDGCLNFFAGPSD
ncbi:MAG: alcohol dehydrogenase catalytic domain-containing protein, partial [Paludibacter sp.]